MNPNTLLLPTVWPRAEPTTVRRCVLLALLLHVWLVVTLGSAPGGTALLGQGVWGAINVTLRGPEQRGAPAALPPPEPVAPSGPPGTATTPRWGGAVRAQQPPAESEPGAAQLGDWSQNPRAAEPPAPDTLPLQAPRALRVVPDLAPGPAPEPGRVVQERVEPLPTLAPVPAAPAPEAPTAVLRTQPRTAAPVATPAAPLAAPPQAVAPAMAAPFPVAPDLAPPPPRVLSSDLGRAGARRAETAAPLAPSTAATETRVQDVAAPALAPVPDAPPVLRQMAAPAPAAARSVAPLDAAPTTMRQQLPAASSVDMPQLQPMPALPAATSPVVQGQSAPGAGAAAADAGARVGQDLATAPSLPASAPRLNLQLARPRGGELSRGMASGGALAVMPRPPDVDEKLGKAIEKTAKDDCRKAYAGAGLLALVPLAVDAVRKEGGCKW